MAKRKRSDTGKDSSSMTTPPARNEKASKVSKAVPKLKPEPSPVLLDLVHTFLKSNNFHNAARALSIDSRLEKTSASFNGAARGLPRLGEMYELWSKQEKPRQSDVKVKFTSSPAISSASESEESDDGHESKEEEDSGSERDSGSSSESESEESNSDASQPHVAPGSLASSSSSDGDIENDISVSAETAMKNSLMPGRSASPSSSSGDSSSESKSEPGSSSESEPESEDEKEPRKSIKIEKDDISPLMEADVKESSSDSSSESGDDTDGSSRKKPKAEESSSSESEESESSSDEGSGSEAPKSESSSDESSSDDESDRPPPAKKLPSKVQLNPSLTKPGQERSDSNASASSSTLKGSPAMTSEGFKPVDASSTKQKDTPSSLKRKRDAPPSNPTPSSPEKRTKHGNEPFSRVPKDLQVDPRFASNKYVSYDYADRAHRDLSVTKGKGFTKEKNKKKRGSYRGGYIDTAPKGIKFED